MLKLAFAHRTFFFCGVVLSSVVRAHISHHRYCVQAEFEFDAATSSFLFVDTHQAAAPKAAAKKKKEKGKSTKSSSKSMPKGAAPRSRMQEATQNPSPVSK